MVALIDARADASKARGPCKPRVVREGSLSRINTALVGRAGEMMVAAELMRRGVEIAHPASDVGVDLLAYRLDSGLRTARKFVPIQVKGFSGNGYRFLKTWFDRAPDLALVLVNNLATTPRCHVFGGLADVEDAIGGHALTPLWIERGIWSATELSAPDARLLLPHRECWERITDQLAVPTSSN